MNEKDVRTEEKEKSTLSSKARQVSAGFIFLMGLYLIFLHGYLAGLLFIVASAIAYEPDNSGKKTFIASISGAKRLIAVFFLLVVALVFLPNNSSNNPSALALIEPVTTPTSVASPALIETPTVSETPIPDVTSATVATSNEASTSNENNPQDNQWSAKCLEDLSIVDDDMRACSNAATNNDFSLLYNNANTLYNDSNTAMNDSYLYSVSPSLQGVKDEYGLVMLDANLAAAWSITGANAYNSGNMTAMKHDMELVNQSTNNYTQHLNELINLLNAYNEKQNN